MDMENLTKTQTVLLTLLVSFVTSIATGIVTVTLMDQAPPAITQTIHKVVERTIETVTPEKQTATAGREVVVVKEQDLVAEVVEKNSKSIFRIFQEAEGKNSFASLGLVIDKGGVIVTGGQNISKSGKYVFSLGEKYVDLDFVGFGFGGAIAYFQISDSASGSLKMIKPISIVKNESLKLGRSVVCLGGKDSFEVFAGIISGFNYKTSEDGKIKETTGIKTSLVEDAVLGSPLLSLDGEGLAIYSGQETSFILLSLVKDDFLKNKNN